MNLNSISHKDLKTCRYLLKFSYIGTNYKGIQRLSKREDNPLLSDDTIQFAIENALQMQLRPVYGSRMASGSRTDSGVHAILNTGHVDLTHPLNNTVYKPSFITESVNLNLIRNGHQIRILSTQMVPKIFHSRRDAKWRSYMYRLAILNSAVGLQSNLCLDQLLPMSEWNRCHIIRRPNFAEMERVVQLFNGCHDFASFTPKQTLMKDNEVIVDTIRTIDEFEFKQLNEIISEYDGSVKSNISLWVFHVKCKSFLYNQIRRMVGSIIDVGLGQSSYERIKYMLENPSYKNWTPNMKLAPARGLWLTNVAYDESDLQFKGCDDEEYHPIRSFVFNNLID